MKHLGVFREQEIGDMGEDKANKFYFLEEEESAPQGEEHKLREIKCRATLSRDEMVIVY